MAAVGLAATIGTSVAVIVLRWHHPTDALGGIAVGIGAVLVLDGILHVPWAIASAFRGSRHDRTLPVQSHPSLA
jgi:membrane-associated phospholipid phosphatase